MKKLISIVLAVLTLIAVTACTPTASPTATPEPAIQVESLKDYTIVYPASYKEWQMTEVTLLQNAIEHLTGTKPNAIADTEPKNGKEIILASSTRETAFDAKIEAQANAMCYVVGVDGDDIVIGGKNYYSDMRAAYDFINNYLGYDDIADTYSEPTKKILGENEVLWQKPDTYIAGSNLNAEPFAEPWHVRDFAECNFNLLQIVFWHYPSDESMRNVATWCARYGVELMFYPYNDSNTKEVVIPCEEDFIENPAIWGLYIVDEPAGDEANEIFSTVCKNAKARFEQYGWNILVNTLISTHDWENNDEVIAGNGTYWTIQNWEKYYSELDQFCFDPAPYLYKWTWRVYVCHAMEIAKETAEKFDQDLFVYIDAYNLKNRGYNDKMFRSHAYLALAFGADCVFYFQYGDASPYWTAEGDWTNGSLVNHDFTKNKYWYDAQKVNAGINKIAPILKQYDHLGVYAVNAKEDDKFTYMLRPLEEFDGIIDIDCTLAETLYGSADQFVVGCFDKKEGDGSAFIILNAETLTDEEYGSTTIAYTKIKVNGNATFYRDGEVIEAEKDDNGYYKVRIPNGECLFVTVEE